MDAVLSLGRRLLQRLKLPCWVYLGHWWFVAGVRRALLGKKDQYVEYITTYVCVRCGRTREVRE